MYFLMDVEAVTRFRYLKKSITKGSHLQAGTLHKIHVYLNCPLLNVSCGPMRVYAVNTRYS
jgi:hypothetical protein